MGAGAVTQVTIWGNHSNTQFPDFTNARIDGKPATEVITITNQGYIPGLAFIEGIPYDGGVLADGGLADVLVWPVPDAGAVIAANVVEVNDFLIPINLSGTLCVVSVGAGNTVLNPAAFVVGIDDAGTSVITGPLTDGNRFLNLPQACPGASGYIALAGPASANPFLVSGGRSGLLGRMQAAQPDGGIQPVFHVPNAVTQTLGITYPRFYDPDVPPGTVIQGDTIFPPGSDAGVQVVPLTLQLSGVENSDFAASQGAYLSFNLSAGILTASLPIDSVGLGYGGLFLPGGAAQTRVIDVNGEAVVDIIAYPSSNTVIDFAPAAIIPNFPNSGPINVHF